MKKSVSFGIAAILVFCLVLLSVTTVFAHPIYPLFTWTDPTATSMDKAVMFNSDILNPAQLPGTQMLGSGMYVPVGIPTPQSQFGGNGLVVSGLPDGKTVQICFSFPSYVFSWAGQVHKWSGTEWLPMPTTIIPATAEAYNTQACTYGAGNGTYALIIGFYGTPQPRRIVY